MIFWELISIHAPAWGVTHIGVAYDNATSISIHAPAWGVTSEAAQRGGCNIHFNPRSRVGSDSKNHQINCVIPCAFCKKH